MVGTLFWPGLVLPQRTFKVVMINLIETHDHTQTLPTNPVSHLHPANRIVRNPAAHTTSQPCADADDKARGNAGGGILGSREHGVAAPAFPAVLTRGTPHATSKPTT